MGTERLSEIIEELDGLVPKEGALIRVGNDDVVEAGEPVLAGNRTGYLRLGIALLRVADAPATGRNPDRVEVDLSGVLDPTCNEARVASFERRENIRPYQEESSADDSKYGSGRFIVPFAFLLIGTLVLVGLYQTMIWISQAFQ